MRDANYADYRELLENISDKSEYQLNSLDKAARCINLYLNLNKTEFICCRQDNVISLNDKLLKLVDHFLHVGHNILYI